jgi:hypothetical protein
VTGTIVHNAPASSGSQNPPASSSTGGGGTPAANQDPSTLLLELFYEGYELALVQQAAAQGDANPILEYYFSLLLTEVYANPLFSSPEGEYALILGYEMGQA